MVSKMSDTIKLIECPRDAWQGLPGQIPTAVKVEYLQGPDRRRIQAH